MKPLKIIPSLIGLFLSTMLMSSSCYKDSIPPATCTEETSNLSRSINFFDFRPTSPYFNQVVANFKFNQSSKSYSGATSCPDDNSSTTLTIQNITSRKITFDYNIIFTLNFVQWNYQGVVAINAGSSTDIGEISNNFASLALGRIVIQSASVTYE